jgi:hypothetical protein
MMTAPDEESAVTDFVVYLLRLLGYHEPNHLIRTRKDIPLFMCSTDTFAKVDVCVINQTSGILLLVQEDKQYLGRGDPEPQLIAEAIAAFQSHNHRLLAAGLPTVDAAVFPGVTMDATAPTFYKIDVTRTLVDAVELGEYPTQTTTVHKLTPPVQ